VESAIKAIPAVGGQEQPRSVEFDPAEMTQCHAGRVNQMPGYTGSVEVGRALAIDHKAAALTSSPLETVVHVAKDHQRQWAYLANAGKGKGKILIAPITGRTFPIPSAGVAQLATQPRRTAVGQQHQRTIGWGRRRCGNDARR